jgi:hypothetical protein
MTRITRIPLAALAAFAVGAPIATAMPIDGSVKPQTGTAAPAPTGATNTPSACTPHTRPVHGPAGTGCTTSPHNNSELGVVLAVVLTGAGSFAIALSASAAAGRRRDRASTAAAMSGRTY